MSSDLSRDAGLELELMERQLYGDRVGTPLPLPWLEESFAAPRPFWELIKRVHDRSHRLPAKSVPFVEYDFYTDIVRRVAGETPALIWYGTEAVRRSLSYAELAARADQLAATWSAAGAAAGQVACIVLPVGATFAVALLAALKLGLVVSVLPPGGRAFIARRLAALAAEHLITSQVYATLFPRWEGSRLSVDDGGAAALAGGDEAAVRPCGYPSGSPCALLFDPCVPGDELAAPVPLSADAAYLFPLRDALLAMGLRPRQVLAAAGLHAQETQPALLLSCLLVGATYLHLELEDLERDPGALLNQPLRALALDERARDLLLRRPLPALGERCGHWIRNPGGSRHLEPWQRFIAANGLDNAWALNVKWDAARGGCTLFSPRRRGLAHAEVLPAAGAAWRLGDLIDPAQPAGGDHGAVFLAGPEAAVDDGTATASVISRHGGLWYFGGSLGVGRQGRHYPLAEVLAALTAPADLPPLSLCDVPRGGDGGDPLIVLIVFVGHEALDQAALRRTLQQRVQGAMGDEFLPDRIVFFELLPRYLDDGEIDHAWCRDQYVRGELYRKAGDELHGCITGLRQRIVEPARRAAEQAPAETEDDR